jgi:hypothetical protein
MKTLISIGSVAISSIALNLLPANPALAASLASGSANLDFTPTTAQSTTVRWGGDNPNTASTTANPPYNYGSAANQSLVTGWTSQGYNFLVPTGNGVATPNTPNMNLYGSNLAAPNGASYFIASDSAYQTGYIYQDLTGLEVGKTYNVSFYQAAAQQNGFMWNPTGINPTTGLPTGAPSTTVKYFGDTTDNWIVNVGGDYTAPVLNGGFDNVSTNLTSSFLGGTTYVAPTMNLASQTAAGSQTYDSGNGTILSGNGVARTPSTVSSGTSTVAAQSGTNVTAKDPTAVGWQQDSFSFTATSTNTRLSFMSQGTPAGKPPFALLSGVSINQIPEPADYVGTLVGFGFIGLAIKSRLAKKKLEE